MIKVLVTGGAGFIGSHLCEYLLAREDKVICVDNFFTGQKSNIEHLLKNPKFELIEHDIDNSLKVERVDEIYNLACPASPVHYQHDPVKTIRTCTVGVVNMLELAKKYQARILQASTSEVYGDPLEHPQKESYWGNVNTVGPRSCYDEGKRVAESLLVAYHKQYDTDYRIVRIFNTYGPRMARNDGRVVSNFIVQALENHDITVYGDGLQTRSFCYVSDMVLGLYNMMKTTDFKGPCNLGNPGEFTILALAEKVIKMIGSQSKIVYKDLPQDDPIKRKPDIGLAKKELKWEPAVVLDDGLGRTIEYFRSVKC